MDRIERLVHPESASGLSGQELYWAVMDRAWPTDEVVSSDDSELEYLNRITLGQQALYTTMVYAREVDNGGVKQFMRNSSGLYTACVLDGLELLNVPELRRPLEQLVNAFPGGDVPTAWQVRREDFDLVSVEELSATRAHEDSIYGKGGFENYLIPYWEAYIQQHPEEFFLTAE